MNKLLMILPLALLSTVPQAQQGKNRVGILNVDTAIQAVSGSKAYLELQARVAADLKAKQQNIQALRVKAASSKAAADQQALSKAQQAYTSVRASHQARIDTEFKPVAAKLNAAVAKVARANGYTVVLDHKVAVQSTVAVYINEAATDLTAAVVKELK